MGCHEPSIAQNGHSIGDARNFLQPMADVNKAHALLPELIDLSKEVFGFIASEGGRRFIQNEELGFKRQGFGDFYLLLGSDTQSADQGCRRNIQP